MTKHSTALLLSTGATTAAAFGYPFAARTKISTKLDANSIALSPDDKVTTKLGWNIALPLDDDDDSRPIFDPLGLYPKDAPERTTGRIRPLELTNPTAAFSADDNDANNKKPVIDPLNLYSNKDAVDDQTDMSIALPFATRPRYLDGSMAGDAGFDPLGLAANSADRLAFMREAELKHARIAMLAALGWPVAELFHTKLAFAWHLENQLQFGDRVPSVLNGGLGHVMGDYWPYMAAALAVGGVVEAFTEFDKKYVARQPGDLGFDPLGFLANTSDEGKKNLELMEIKNGRAAMMAVTLFALQEAFTGTGVVSQLASALHPHAAEFTAQELSYLPELLDRPL